MQILKRPWWLKLLYSTLLVLAVACVLSATTDFNSWISKPLVTRDSVRAADAVIVLGGGLKKDCTLGKRVSERVLQGVALVKQEKARRLIMSGGKVPHTNCTESNEMKKFAVAQGIPELSILTEEASTSTYENAVLTKALVQEAGVRTFLLTTSPFHTRRACAVFRNQEMAVSCIPAERSLGQDSVSERLRLLKAILREYIATLYYQIQGYI